MSKVSSLYSVDFDGVDDNISIPTLTIPTTGSLSLRWQPNEDPATSDHPIFIERSASGNLFDIYLFNGVLYCGWSNAAFDKRTAWAISGITQGAFHHLVLTWTNGGTTTLYINGVSVATTSGLNATWNTSAETANMAKNNQGSPAAKCRLDDVRLYNVALTGANVISLLEGNEISSGLTAYWKLDEGSGTSAADSSGNGKTGTLNNGAAFSSTVPGALTTIISTYRLKFNGNGGGDFSVVTFSNAQDWSLSAWIKPTANDIAASYATLCANGSDPGIFLHNGYIDVLSGGTDNLSSAPLVAGTEYHIVVTHTAGTTLIYINNVLDTTISASLTMQFRDFGASDGSTGTQQTLEGWMDDLRIYGRLITAFDVATLYNGQSIETLGNFFNYWKFDDGSGATAADSSGAGDTATLSGNETWTASPNVPIPLGGSVATTGNSNFFFTF